MDRICPLLTFDMEHPEPCIEHRCMFYTTLQGKHPQKDTIVDEHGCAIAWLPLLMIENSQQQRHTSAAIESFRNEMVKSNDIFSMLMGATREQIEDKS